MSEQIKITPDKFYSDTNGHSPKYLQTICNKFRQNKNFVFLAGDFTLDNKKAISKYVEAVNGYEEILHPPESIPDITFHLNTFSSKLDNKNLIINCTTGNNTLNEHDFSSKISMNQQDQIIIDNIKQDDILVISIGSNDIISKPTGDFISRLMKVCPDQTEYVNYDELKYFAEYFYNNILTYIKQLCIKNVPKLIIICGAYFPSITKGKSMWSNQVLDLIDYNVYPSKLQSVLSYLYNESLTKINIDGYNIKYITYSDILDGSDDDYYYNRLYLSNKGGYILSKKLWKFIQSNL